MEAMLQFAKNLLSLCLMLAILAGGITLPILWEDSSSAMALSRQQSLVEPIYEVQINESGNMMLVMTRNDVIIRDLHSGMLIQELSFLQGKASTAVWVPHSQKILAGCRDGRLLMLDEFQITAASSFAKTHKHAINSIAISQAGTLAVTGSSDRICLWDLVDKKLLAQIAMHGVIPTHLRFSSDEAQLLAGCRDGRARLFQAGNLRLIQDYRLDFNAIVGADFIEGRQTILAASLGGNAFLINTATDQVRQMDVSCCLNLLDIAVSPDQQHVAVTDWTNGIHVYSLETFEKVASLNGHSNGVSTLKFSRTQPWLYSGSYDGTLRIWDLRSFSELYCCQGSLPWDED
jgi:WD40 repeat protein